MTFDHPRSDWLPKGESFPAPAAAPSRIERIVIHYIGTNTAPRDSARWMLQTHRATMARENPYAFMYNAHIDIRGETWQGRGVEFRNAANGADTNATTWSIVFGVDGQNAANPAQIQAARKLIRDYRNFLGRNIPLAPHKVIKATRCPGDGITAQIQNRIFEEPLNVTRIAGSNRYETAALASQAAYPTGAPVCYVVSGENFPDALAAGSFSNGPVLLTQATRLPKATADEVRRLRVKRVVVIGGTSVVSQSVVEELDRLVV
jgi:hypothetical protein